MSENKTNAPTIKLPVRYFPPFSEIQDADGDGILRVNGAGQEKRDGIAPFIVAALNEADALRAEVEGYRAMLDRAGSILVGVDDDPEGPVYELINFDNGKWGIRENAFGSSRSFDTVLEAYDAAIKPNAAAGEEGQDGK